MSDTNEPIKKFKLEELSEITGLSRRTIRFYIQKKLLQAPLGEKRGSYYTTEHLERLLHIKSLTDRHVPLNDILIDKENPTRDDSAVGTISVCSHISLGAGMTLVVDHSAAKLSGATLKELAEDICDLINEYKGTE